MTYPYALVSWHEGDNNTIGNIGHGSLG